MTKFTVYVSPKRFSLPVATDDTNDIATTVPLTDLEDDPVNLPHTGRDIGLPAPPIHISNYSAFNYHLTLTVSQHWSNAIYDTPNTFYSAYF